MRDNKYTIYSISIPLTNQVFYVGKTANYKVRQKQHLYKSHNLAVRSIIEDLLLEQKMPVFSILEVCHRGIAGETERKWINHFFGEVDGICNLSGKAANYRESGEE